MRSYGQYCALARALDVVGDRWTLLIVRELAFRDSRYSDLRDGLPGIATNLLAARLRQLEANGIIESFRAPRPVGATLYRLTPRGRELGPVLQGLVAWGVPLLDAGQGADSFRSHWLAMAVRVFFSGVDVTDLAPLTVVVDTGHEPATIQIDSDGLTVGAGAPPADDAVMVEGEPGDAFALLCGSAGAKAPAGVNVRGPKDAVRRMHALTKRSRLAA